MLLINLLFCYVFGFATDGAGSIMFSGCLSVCACMCSLIHAWVLQTEAFLTGFLCVVDNIILTMVICCV